MFEISFELSLREKIFWTTFDPTKNPFEARLSAARTTPSLLRMPTVVVMLNLGPLCGRSGMLIRVTAVQSQGGLWNDRSDRGMSPLHRPRGHGESPLISDSPPTELKAT